MPNAHHVQRHLRHVLTRFLSLVFMGAHRYNNFRAISISTWREVSDTLLSESEFKTIYAEYAPMILKLTHQWLGDMQAAEDVTHDVFLAFLENPERYDPKKASLRTYLTMMARYQSIDYMRRAKREIEWDVNTQPGSKEQLFPLLYDAPVEREFFKKALWKELTQALQDLRALEREVIIGHYVHGASHRLLAERLNRPLGTVKSALLHGLNRLRRHFLKIQWRGDEHHG